MQDSSVQVFDHLPEKGMFDHLPEKVTRQYSADGPPELSTPARKEMKRRSLNLMFKVQ